MGMLTGLLDALFLAYFVIHIPTTVLVDSQSVIPAEYFPTWARDLLKWHIETNGDHLVSKNPVWFTSMVCCEVALQLPFFFVAAYAFAVRANWIRIPAIVYGAHVATTMVPILGDILYGPDSGPKKGALAAIYVPYLIVPVLLVARMAAAEKPFAERRGGRARKGRGGKATKAA